MWFIHLVMLFSVVSLCVMVYNYHTRPRVSNVLWYANVDEILPDSASHCGSCYRAAYDTTVNQGRVGNKARHETRLLNDVAEAMRY